MSDSSRAADLTSGTAATAPLPSPSRRPEIEQRHQPELLGGELLGRLGGTVAGRPPGHAAGRQVLGHGGLGQGDDTVEQHRYAGPGRGDQEADPGRDVRRAEGRQSGHRVGDPGAGAVQGALDQRGLGGQGRVVDPGAAAGDLGRRETEGGRDQRGRRGRVADAHVADDQQVGAGGDLLGGDGGTGGQRSLRLGRGQGVLAVDGAGGPPDLVRPDLGRQPGQVRVHREIQHPYGHVVLPGQDADAGHPGHEGADHGGGDLARIGGDAGAPGRHPVITGQHHRPYVRGRRGRAGARAGGPPDGEILEPAERPGGFGQGGHPLPRLAGDLRRGWRGPWLLRHR